MSDSRSTIAVLSDLHANARALRAAYAAALNAGFDHLVVLGDLLTYGADVAEVLAIVNDMQAQHHARLLLGNHDLLYLDLANNERSYYDKLPAWLRETADWTFSQLDISALRDELSWDDEVIIGSTYFAHANPFGVRDFRYLNHDPEIVDAARAVQQKGAPSGVHGHTHRAALMTVDTAAGRIEQRDATRLTQDLSPRQPLQLVANPGSIGQPRGGGTAASWLRIVQTKELIDFDIQRTSYDVAAHVRSLSGIGLQPATHDKLVAFFHDV